jgi:membrane-bound metal-dependent hydrolase YbcI (DUF457 family)
MFVGHYGAAFAGKKLAPGVSLGWLFLAASFVDVLWPVFLRLGWEKVEIVNRGQGGLIPLEFPHYPITHSLLGTFGWALLLSILYWLRRRRLWAALVLLLVGVSHWVLDWLTHRGDLPLLPGGPKYGLGLWDIPAAAIAVELAVFALGVALYLSATNPRSGRKTWGPWGLVSTLLLIQALSYFGPPPENNFAVVMAGLALWVLVPWAYWVDRRRESKAFRSDALFRLGAEAE